MRGLSLETSLEKLAGLIQSISFEKIPDNVIERAKTLILDSIACMVGGTNVEEGQKMIRFYETMEGPAEASVVTWPRKLHRYHAASVNAYLANLLDFDDTYYGHPGASIVPTALACGEYFELDGEKILEAVVSGYEVGMRIMDSMMPSPERLKVVRGTSTFQIFASAATAGRLSALSEEEMLHALSMAGVHAPVPSVHKSGTEQHDIGALKNNLGWAAMGAMISSDLARDGFRSNTSLLDGEKGFWIMSGSDQFQPDRITRLEHGYLLEKVHLKPYCACRFLHPALNAMELLTEKREIKLDTIERIEVQTFSLVLEKYGFFPNKLVDIPFSLPYVIAMMLMKIKPGYDWYDENKLNSDEVKKILQKVQIIPWNEADHLYSSFPRKLAAKVSIETTGGSNWTQEVRIPKGDPLNPMTRQELKKKFSSLVVPLMGEKKAEEVYELLMSLEKVKNLKRLTDLLR